MVNTILCILSNADYLNLCSLSQDGGEGTGSTCGSPRGSHGPERLDATFSVRKGYPESRSSSPQQEAERTVPVISFPVTSHTNQIAAADAFSDKTVVTNEMPSPTTEVVKPQEDDEIPVSSSKVTQAACRNRNPPYSNATPKKSWPVEKLANSDTSAGTNQVISDGQKLPHPRQTSKPLIDLKSLLRAYSWNFSQL
jgi:hypothetical protein